MKKPERTLAEKKERLSDVTGEERAQLLQAIVPALSDDELSDIFRDALTNRDRDTLEVLVENENSLPDYLCVGDTIKKADEPNEIINFLLDDERFARTLIDAIDDAYHWSSLMGVAGLPESAPDELKTRELFTLAFDEGRDPGWYDAMRDALDRSCEEDIAWLVRCYPGEFNTNTIRDLVQAGYFEHAKQLMDEGVGNLSTRSDFAAWLALDDERTREWVAETVGISYNTLINAHQRIHDDGEGEADYSRLKPFIDHIKQKRLVRILKHEVDLEDYKDRELTAFLLDELDEVPDFLPEKLLDGLVASQALDTNVLGRLVEHGLDLSGYLDDEENQENILSLLLHAHKSLERTDHVLHELGADAEDLVDTLIVEATQSGDERLVHFLDHNWLDLGSDHQKALLAEAVVYEQNDLVQYWGEQVSVDPSESRELLVKLFANDIAGVKKGNCGADKIASTIVERLAGPDDVRPIYRAVFKGSHTSYPRDICAVLTQYSQPPPVNFLESLSDNKTARVMEAIEPYLNSRQRQYSELRDNIEQETA